MKRGFWAWFMPIFILTFLASIAAFGQEPVQLQKPMSPEETRRVQLIESLGSLNDTLLSRQNQLDELSKQLAKSKEEAETDSLSKQMVELKNDIAFTEGEIDVVILGLQSREYNGDGLSEQEFVFEKELGQIFEPLIISLERATEPARRMEELRQLSEQVDRRRSIIQATLDHINAFKVDENDYTPDIETQLKSYQAIWLERLGETDNLAAALEEEKAAAQQAQGNSLASLTDDIGGFIVNRGANLLYAIGYALGFFLICQFLKFVFSFIARKLNHGYLNAPARIVGLILTGIGIAGAMLITITVFNIRHDWLMMVISLLVAIALLWSFGKAIPGMLTEVRTLLNLGAVREGERTLVGNVPFRIEKLGLYSKLVNLDLNGGSVIYPVKELIGMHSRPVLEDENWFPTRINDWIVRNDKHYQVINQTPEHVILRRPGGADDHVPVDEFLGTVFERLTDGYRRSHTVGLSYELLDIAPIKVPEALKHHVTQRVKQRVGEGKIQSVNVDLHELADSSINYLVQVDLGAACGEYWQKIKSDIVSGTVDACIKNNWEIPFPQMVVHNVT